MFKFPHCAQLPKMKIQILREIDFQAFEERQKLTVFDGS